MTKNKKLFTVVLSVLAVICLAFGFSGVSAAQVNADDITVLTDKDTFVSTIKADPSGNFELGGDIDFGGVTLSESIDFSGTLDGRGYSLKNFKLGITEANGWYSRFINVNTGTIKNIGLEITSIKANNNEFGFINTNKGNVSNVYVDFNFDSTQIINQWCHYGTIAVKNDGGTIENCIVDISVVNGVDIGVGQGENGNIFAAICAYNVNGGVPKTLKRGHQGCAVRLLQDFLNRWAEEWHLQKMQKLALDGDFGAKTEQLLKRFQQENGLKPDGKYGRATNRKMKLFDWGD